MEDDDVEDDPSHMRLLAEPPREDGFEAFYSERPAFVLARVDGDELAHLLDSRAGTPLDTPRVDGDEDKPGARRAHSAGSKRSGGSRKEQEVRKPARWGADIEDDILEPGPAEEFTELDKIGSRPASVEPEERKRSPGDQSDAPTKKAPEAAIELSERDSALAGNWQFFGNDPGTEKQKLWTIAQARLLCIISLYAATGVYPEDEETWIKILHLHVLVFEGIQLRLFDMSLVPTPLTATTPAGISRQIFLQVAPQTTTFLNDLARMGLLNCLRIMTHGQWPTSAYQVSERGQEFVAQMPEQLKHEMHVLTRGSKIMREIPPERRTKKKKKKKKKVNIEVKVEGGEHTTPFDREGSEHSDASDHHSEHSGDSEHDHSDRSHGHAHDGHGHDHGHHEAAGHDHSFASLLHRDLDEDDFEEVDFSHEMLEVTINEHMRIVLRTEGGYFRESAAADPPHVPHVTSPYIPHSLRHSATPTTDNSHRGYECALWPTQLEDDGQEVIVLSNVTAVFAEWFPVGPNVVQSLIERLDGLGVHAEAGARMRCTLSSQLDLNDRLEGGTGEYGPVEVSGQQIVASMLDCRFGVNVNVEASVLRENEDEEKNLVRSLQEFGVHLSTSGLVLCGVQFEGIMAREWDDMPPTFLAHAAHTLQHACSEIVSDLVTKLQRDVLAVLFEGEEAARPKYIVYVADALEPSLPTAAEYLDGGRFQHTLIEMVGEIITAKVLGKDELLFVGSQGLVLAGPQSRDHDVEEVLLNYVSLMVMDLTIRKVFTRVRVLNDSLAEQYRLIQLRNTDPEKQQESREMIHASGTSAMLLSHVVVHVLASIQRWEQVENDGGLAKALEESLRVHGFHEEVLHRAEDLERNLERSRFEVKCLQEIADMEDRIALEGVYSAVQHGTHLLTEAQGGVITHTGDVRLPAEVPVRIVVASLAAKLAFDVIGRLHMGIEAGVGPPAWFISFFEPLNLAPWVFWLLQLAAVGLVASSFMWYFEQKTANAQHYMWRKIALNKKIDVKRMLKFLERAGCSSARHEVQRTNGHDRKVITATFRDNSFFRWYGDAPQVVLEVDVTNGFVLSARLSWAFFLRRINKKDAKEAVLDMLLDAKVIADKQLLKIPVAEV